VTVKAETFALVNKHILVAEEAKLKSLHAKFTENYLAFVNKKITEEENGQILATLTSAQTFCEQQSEFFKQPVPVEKLIKIGLDVKISTELLNAIGLQTRKTRFCYEITSKNLASFDSSSKFGDRILIASILQAKLNYYKFLEILIKEGKEYAVQSSKIDFPSSITVQAYTSFVLSLPLYRFSDEVTDLAKNYNPTSVDINRLNFILKNCISKQYDANVTLTASSFSGQHLVLSRILEKYNNFTGELSFFATDKIFIDVNLSLVDTHLTLTAPVIEVVPGKKEHIIFSLLGSSLPLKSYFDMYPPRRGRDGGDGYSSGNVLIAAIAMVNGKLLTVKSVGGDGSKGQNGQPGITATKAPLTYLGNGNWGTESELKNFVTSNGYQILYFYNFKTISRKFDVLGVWKQNSDSRSMKLRIRKNGGTPPTDGGNGGNGGSGAIHGDVLITFEGKTHSNSPNVTFINGNNGLGGAGGPPGITAPSCYDTVYTCDGRIIRKKMLWFQVGSAREIFTCTAKSSEPCDTNFSVKRYGIAGAPGKTADRERFKFRMTTQFSQTTGNNLCKHASKNPNFAKLNQFIINEANNYKKVEIMQNLASFLREKKC
jgi:hypothetical protein